MTTGQSHSNAAYGAIFDLIMSGEISADSAISTRSLADRTGIGRTPIREALQALARDGVIDIVPMRGSFVRQPDIEEVRELYEVRVALEGMAALLVAQRGLSTRLRQIGAELEAMRRESTPDLEAVRLKGWEFHDQLMVAAGNGQLRELYTQVARKFSLVLRQGRKYADSRVIETLDEHIELFHAIEAGQGLRAQALMQAHIQRAFSARMKAIADFPAVPGA